MNLISAARTFSQGFLNLVMPPVCLSCKTVVEEQGQICAECWKGLNFIGKYSCSKCGLPFDFDHGDKAICSHCQKDKPIFTKAKAVFRYSETSRKLATNLKFHDKTHLAPYLAGMMANAGMDIISKCQIVAPVPLHKRRQFFRRYNQSALLAKHICKITSKHFEPFLLSRTRATKQQTTLSKAARKENVLDAFLLNENIDVKGKTILLVDDVMTTGATLNACAAELKKAGAKSVYCLVLARVVPGRD